MAGYAIMHLEKCKTMADLKRLAGHHERTSSNIPNAKPPFDSQVATGSGNMVDDIQSRFPAKIRSNAVLAIEFMLTTSPESMRVNDDKNGPLDPKKVEMFKKAANKFLAEHWGGLASGRFHYDETTPHVQGFFCVNNDWIPGAPLNAKKMSNPESVFDWHTEWAAALVEAGLDVKRGELGSQAEHQPIQKFYGMVNAEKPAPPALAPKPAPPSTTEKLKEAAGMETDHSKGVQARNDSKIARQGFFKETYEAASARALYAENESRQFKKRAEKAEAKLVKIKKETDELRSIPLWQVLEAMGCERHPDDKLRWATSAGHVWIEEKGGPRFNSFDDPTLKGRGAIDLVMKINGQKFDQAAAWLASQFGHEATTKDAAGFMVEQAREKVAEAVLSVSEPTPLPYPEPSRLERVEAYLTKARGIPAALVATLIEQGRIYADKFANVCFRTDTGAGVEMRGTVKPRDDSASFHGHRGPKEGFTVPGDPLKVAIVESAIEAMSLHATNGMTAVSVGGANPKRAIEIARSWLAKGATVFAAQNADKAGDKQAEALMYAVPGVHRLKPMMQDDWNDLLKIQNESVTAESPNAKKSKSLDT